MADEQQPRPFDEPQRKGQTAETAATAGAVSSGVLGDMLDMLGGDSGGTEPLPKQIGHYKIIRKLGRGGMGIVLLGVRDDDQFHKRVAIKLIRRGIDSAADGREVLKRFDLERQVLGALNHPNIARLLDAGQMPEPDARPYFVMEYVEGEPIDQFCDRMEMTIEERLGLFQKVCAAVHHAHQNLVVHRDIKPGNILVDMSGEPKLMDFGIAKLLNPAMAGVTLATSWDRGPMTPEYASPEQVQGKPISTASDVYALGVLLYELLTGRRPYKLKSRAIDAIVKAICEDEPERPSTVVTQEKSEETSDGTTRTTTADALAKPREGAVTRLKRRLLGDVDNIVLMAMRKSPQRRYPSAEAFAADIGRHLHGQPVTAAPDSVVYRMGKFVRRNKLGVAAGVVVIGALVVGAVAADFGRRAAREGERVQKEARAHEAVIAKENIDLAGGYFKTLADALKKLEGATDARVELAMASIQPLEKLAKERKDDPDVQRQLAQNYALVSDVLGGARDGTKGDPEKARDPLDKSIKIARELAARASAGPEDVRLLAGDLIRLGELRRKLPAIGDAGEAFGEAMRVAGGGTDTEPKQPDLRRLFAQALSARADAGLQVESASATRSAGEDYLRSLDIRERLLRDDPSNAEYQRDYTVGLNRAAGWYARTSSGRQKAEELYEKALTVREDALRRDSNARTKHDVLTAAGSLGRFLMVDPPDPDAASAKIDREYELATDLLHTDADSARADESMCWAALDIGQLRALQGDHTGAATARGEAVEHARALVKRSRASVSNRWHLARSLLAHAESLEKIEKVSLARDELEQSKALWADLGSESPNTPAYKVGLKDCDRALKRLDRP